MKLVSVNIEWQKHLDTVGAFLAREAADVVALMEVVETDVPTLAGERYPYMTFMPNCRVGEQISGVAVLSRYPISTIAKLYCGRGSETDIPIRGTGTHAPVVLLADVATPEGVYRIGAVHFTWTPDGQPTPEQERDVATLLAYLPQYQPLILAGDFNIPRKVNRLYDTLHAHLIDNIPEDVVNSIDPDLHYANKEERGKLSLMVDYVWTTPEYTARGVRLVNGVSDHCAVVGALDSTLPV